MNPWRNPCNCLSRKHQPPESRIECWFSTKASREFFRNPQFSTGHWTKLFVLRRFFMSQKVQPIPQGFHTLTPHLIVRNADQAIEFYKKAFGAEVVGGIARMPDGKVMHAELRIGDSILMLNDEMPEFGAVSPHSANGSSVTIHIFTGNVDAAFE